jgi:SnoaL-like domain
MIDAGTYTAIQQLQRSYADIATRMAWDEAASVLAPQIHITFNTSSGAVHEIEGLDAYAEFGAQMTGFAFYEYLPMSFVVSPGADGTLVGRTYSLEVAENDAGEWLEFYGQYDDTYAKVDGEWRFTRRIYRTVKQRVTKSAP